MTWRKGERNSGDEKKGGWEGAKEGVRERKMTKSRERERYEKIRRRDTR